MRRKKDTILQGLFQSGFAFYFIFSCFLWCGSAMAAEHTADKKRAKTEKMNASVSGSGMNTKKKKVSGKKCKAVKIAKPQRRQMSKNLNKSIKRVWDFQTPASKQIPNFWEPVTGKWVLTVEPEHPGNRVVRQTMVKRSFQYLLSRNKFVNFEFSAKLRTDMFEQKTRNWQMGLLFRRANAKYYYKFRITAANVALLRCSPESLTVLPGSRGSSRAASVTGRFGKKDEHMLMILPRTNVTDQWHTLSVACYGERIVLKLNGREIRMFSDPVIGSGKVGVYTYKTQAFVDDIRLFYLPVPALKEGIRLTRDVFNPVQDRELLIYYKNPEAGLLEVRVLDFRGKLFYSLTKGVHSAGISSVVWDGRGLDRKSPAASEYTIELNVRGKKYQAKVRVKPSPPAAF